MLRTLLVVALLWLPTALADWSLDDRAGDVAISPGQAPIAGPVADQVDILNIGMEEGAEELVFTVTTAAEIATTALRPSVAFQFEFQRNTHVVEAFADGCEGGALYTVDHGDNGLLRFVTCVPAELGATYRIPVPHDEIRSELGVSLRAGDVVAEMGATALVRTTTSSGAEAAIMDFVGYGDATYTLTHGLANDSSIHLATQTPVRVSNGEAGTFVWPISIANTGSEQATVQLTIADAPNDWHIIHPPAAVVGSQEALTVPVIVTIPFAHAHGTTDAFDLVATADSGVGTLQLGIHFVEVPQPAGHHDTMYFHSKPTTVGLPGSLTRNHDIWFNSLDEARDPAATDEPASPSFFSGVAGGDATWRIPLSPGLLVGLDFTSGAPVELDAPIQLSIPLGDAQLTGNLYYREACPGTDGRGCSNNLLIANGTGPLGPIELQTNPSLRRLPFQPGSGLFLDIVLVTQLQQDLVAQGARPHLQTADATMRLPLYDFKDQLTDAFDGHRGLEVSGVSAVTHLAREGMDWFPVHIHNNGTAPADVRLAVAGPAGPATRVEPTSHTIPAGQSHGFTVSVDPKMLVGDEYSLWLMAYDAEGRVAPAAQPTTLDFSADAPRAQAPDNEANAVGFGVAMILVGLAYVQSRRG